MFFEEKQGPARNVKAETRQICGHVFRMLYFSKVQFSSCTKYKKLSRAVRVKMNLAKKGTSGKGRVSKKSS